ELIANKWAQRNCETTISRYPYPFVGGYTGVIPYEYFTSFSDASVPLISCSNAALLFDQIEGQGYVVAYDQESLTEAIAEAHSLLESTPHLSAARGHIALAAQESDESYEEKVKRALADIRSGR